jgi:DNA-binding response OmpR family regulator
MIRVLFAEDDAGNRIAMEALLSDEGFVVDTVASFAEARARIFARGARYDLAILDVHLGDGTGTALLPELRERHPGVKVFCLSGSSGETDVTVRVDGWFRKGDDIESLISTLAELVSRGAR